MKHPSCSLQLLARDSLVAALVSSLVLGPAAPVFANPRDHVTVRGNVSYDGDGTSSMTITAPNGSIIRWGSFDIDRGETVQFIQPNADARVLNRVTSSGPSTINGTLLGDGHVYIVNPAGVVFGANSTVNVNGLHAAGGRISDDDFVNGNDRYTGVRGDVRVNGPRTDGATAAQITARAVALVGEHVVVEAGARIFADGGWIVLAAGNDVLIGRDENGRGILLRVENAADAVFDRNDTGVLNQGTLDAGVGAAGGRVSIGAGDIYGTAVFSDSAIQARQLALEAHNRGDVALAGTVRSTDLDTTMRGTRTGEIRGADEGSTTTVQADNLRLTGTGSGSTVNVGEDIRFRSQASDTTGPATVAISQASELVTSDLENLDIAPGAGTALSLKSTTSNVIVDDRRLVTGTKLALESASTATTSNQITGTGELNVASLAAKGVLRTEGDIVSPGGITVTQNLVVVTKPESAENPAQRTLLSAHEGTLDVDGDITTTDGGRLRIEARNVDVGKTDENDLTSGGLIQTTGTAQGGISIGFTDAAGVQQTQNVKARAIDTRGLDGVEGGDVDIRATGDIEVTAVSTGGGIDPESTATAAKPNLDGGNVDLHAGDRLRVDTVLTGGADEDGSGEISLSGASIVLADGIDASGGTVGNPRGNRDRDVTVDGALSLDADIVSILGGNVTVTGPITEATPEPEAGQTPVQRTVQLGVQSSGTTRLGPMSVESLSISTKGNEVVFTGDVTADKSVDVRFDIDDKGVIRGERGAGDPDFLITAKSVGMAAFEGDDDDGHTAELELGDGLGFRLSADVNADPKLSKAAFLLFNQDKDLSGAQVSRLLDKTTVTDDTALALELGSNDMMTLDQASRDALANEGVGVNLTASARRFVAEGATGAATDFRLRSLDLSTRDGLDVNFGVTTSGTGTNDGLVSLHGGSDGTGNVNVLAPVRMDAKNLKLIAGDGVGGSASDARVTIDPGARLVTTAKTETVDLIQDAGIDSADLPDVAVFGGSVAGLGYGLESRDADLVLSPGSQAKFAGSRLRVFGQTDVDLGDDELFLASLDASSAAALTVHQKITTSEGGTIRLHGGTDGSGDLTLSSALEADSIELLAGVLDGTLLTSRVEMRAGAHFSDASGTTRPDSFLLEQDAAIGSVTPGGGQQTPIPTLAMFAGNSVAGMDYTLRSRGSIVTIDQSALVNGTRLELQSKNGTTVRQNLDVADLTLVGPSQFLGNITSAGSIDVTGPMTLASTAGAQTIAAGHGADDTLKIVGLVTKTTNGAIALTGREIEVADVVTAHRGDSITVTGDAAVKTGALDASGQVRSAGGAVTVTSTTGSVEVASIDTSGADGAGSASTPQAGAAGGNVSVTGQSVAIGNVSTIGGNGTPLGTNNAGRTTAGGNAGTVAISSTGTGDITLRGSIDARGGAGSSTDPETLPPPSGSAANVTLNGNLVLDASSNSIHGATVAVSGGVAPIAARRPVSGPGQTALTVVGQSGVSFGGNLAASKIDIETQAGNLALGSQGVSTISADTIRLAATDGAGGHTDGEVVLDGLTFANEPRGGTPTSAITFRFTLEQDASIGTGGTEIPQAPLFAGVDSVLRALGLVSYDGTLVLDGTAQADQVRGTELTLAANGLAGGTGPAIRVNGADLDVVGLSLGTTGIDQQIVGGDARLDGDVNVAKSFISYGDTTVTGAMNIGSTASFAGDGSQTLSVGGEALRLGGANVTKTTDGDLHLDARRIELTSSESQIIENLGGMLEIGSTDADGLVKGAFGPDGAPITTSPANLTLRGVAAKEGESAVVVHGTRETAGVGTHAVLVADGNLTIDARVAPDDSSDPVGPGTWSVDGDVVAYGDIDLKGQGALAAGRDGYTIDARRQAVVSRSDRGGELHIDGLASADADVVLRAAGPVPPADGSDPHPGGIFTDGDFTTNHALTFAGTTETEGSTSIDAGGDLTFTGRVQGGSDFSAFGRRQVSFGDDVIMEGAASFSAAANEGVVFASTSDLQTVQAKNIRLGAGAMKPAASGASVFRDGDLTLNAIGGDVGVARGQRMVVAGKLDVAAKRNATLANTAALGIDVRAGKINVHGGSTVAANRIGLSSEPNVQGGGTAFFATPTGTEISDSAANAQDVVLRQIGRNGERLTRDSLLRIEQPGDRVVGVFPAAAGPARIDFATETPKVPRPVAIVRPKGDAQRLALAREARPLWADELLVYLEERSLVAPTPQEQEALPPVNAGPSDAKASIGGVPLGEQALLTLPPYRALFRPSTDIDPDTGLIVGGNRVREIRAALAQAHETGGDLGRAIDASPAASAEREKLAALFAASSRALDAEQNARFRAMVCARVAPQGVSAAELDALIP
jgi:filamentous hemagglutinin family protein